MQLGAGGALRLPLLLEDLLQLRSRDLDRHDGVRERLHVGDVTVGDRAVLAVEQVGAEPAGVDHPDARRSAGVVLVRGGPQVHVGESVAHGRLDAAVVSRRSAAAQDVTGDRSDLDRTLHLSDLDGVGDDLGDLGIRRIEGGLPVRQRNDRAVDRDELLGLGVDRDLEQPEGLAVLQRLDHRPLTPTGGGEHAGVFLVRVAGCDGVDVVGRAGDQLRVVGVLRRQGFARVRRGAVMREEHDDVGEIAVRDLCGHAVRGLQLVAELDVGYTVRRDHDRGVGRDRSDERDAYPVDVLDVVLLEDRILGPPRVHVRTQAVARALSRIARAVARRRDIGQEVETLVEFVVPDRAQVQPGGHQGVDRGQVVLDEGGERRRADVVTCRDEQRVRVLRFERVDGPGDHGSARNPVGVALQPAVEVVDRQHVDLRDVGRRLRGQTDHHRVVVRGPVHVVGVEQRAVVVVAAVLEGDELTRVDVPDVTAGRTGERVLVHQDVIERAREPGERIRRRVDVECGLRVDVSGSVEHLHRVLLAVGVEVAGEDDALGVASDLLDPFRQGRRLAHARLVAAALPVAGVGVTGPGAR